MLAIIFLQCQISAWLLDIGSKALKKSQDLMTFWLEADFNIWNVLICHISHIIYWLVEVYVRTLVHVVVSLVIL